MNLTELVAAIERLPPEQRREAEQELRELEAQLVFNPLLRYNNPLLLPPEKIHRKQLVFHESRDPTKIFAGGNRGGKTTAGIADNLVQALPDDLVPEHLKPYKKWQPPFIAGSWCRS